MNVGIDLGTTYSAISYLAKDGNVQIITNSDGGRITPSVVLFEEDNVIVGDVAKSEKTFSPHNVVDLVKRSMGMDINYPIGGKNYKPEEISAYILKKLVIDAENSTGEKVEGAVITVPAYFNDSERQATIDAGNIAGIDVLAIINEPTAAAIGYGIGSEQNNVGERVLVFDFGGGTFDITILEIEENGLKMVATDGDHRLGGVDLDAVIIDFIATEIEDQFDIDIDDDLELEAEVVSIAEKIKRALSTKNSERISLKVDGQSYRSEYTIEQFEEAIEGVISKAFSIMMSCISDANLTIDQIDKVLLVGGSTRVPLIKKKFEQEYNIIPSQELNPDEIVSHGAAIFAAKKNIDKKKTRTGLTAQEEQIKNLSIQDVCSHGIGIISINIETNQKQNSIIIPKNSPIPITCQEEFETMRANQTSVYVEVTEGDDDDINFVEIIATATMNLDKNLPEGSPLIFEAGYDENGSLIVTGYDGRNNRKLGNIIVEKKANLNSNDVVAIQKKVSQIKVK